MRNKKCDGLCFFLISILALFALAGCGPRYKTEYSYRPPQGPEGQNCLMQCESIKQQCRINEDYRYRACEADNKIANLEYSNCVAEKRDHCFNAAQYCNSANYKRCDMDYRICYQNCGGTISSREVCVSGCRSK